MIAKPAKKTPIISFNNNNNTPLVESNPGKHPRMRLQIVANHPSSPGSSSL